MRRAFTIPFLASFFVMAAISCNGHTLFAANQDSPQFEPALKKPAKSAGDRSIPWTPVKPTVVAASKLAPPAKGSKLEEIGKQLGRTLDIALDFLSGNKTALLSGNSPKLFSDNCPKLLSGNSSNVKVLSDNETPLLSGNSISLFSNIKIEIHIENAGNNPGPGMPGMPGPPSFMRTMPTRPVPVTPQAGPEQPR